MKSEYHKHDISDRAWELLKNYLPGQKGKQGGQARDNRQFINALYLDSENRCSMAGFAAVLWGLEKHSPRFCRWRDFEWLMIDAFYTFYIKVHSHAAGVKGGNQAMWRTKGGSIRRYTLR